MREKLLKIFKSSFTTVSVLVVIIIWTGGSYYLISSAIGPAADIASDTSNTDTISAPEDCNVYGINIHGDVVTYNSNDAYNDQDKLIYDQTPADEVIWAVEKAQDAENVKALIIEIDSGGGYPVAGEEMMRAFKDSKKPVIAFIRTRGTSAAYMAATGAETIFASESSDVGSIGVTQSYLQNTDKNKKDGLTYIDLASGKFKDTGSPDKVITQEEKDYLMRDINIMYNHFVALVSQNRNLSIEKVKALADGSSILGAAALKAGLIDKIGLFPDVKNFVSEKIGTPVTVCWQN